MKENYTRNQLLKICEQSFVPCKYWSDRDTPESQAKLGKCYALLKDGCNFKILTEGNLKTDEETIWLEITYTDFRGFEYGERDNESENFYLPTQKRLNKVKGRDWY